MHVLPGNCIMRLFNNVSLTLYWYFVASKLPTDGHFLDNEREH